MFGLSSRLRVLCIGRKRAEAAISGKFYSHKSKSSNNEQGPPVDENGLYYGQFTKEEYENAARQVRENISKLEGEIKGDTNVRENLGKMAQFPQKDPLGATKINNLTDLFTQTIKTTGPMTLSAYMRQCLTHPEFGYYTTRNPLDKVEGDFITSPEISSIFGEMVGIWLLTVWQQQGKPSKIKVIEFGPGKGTLMHDTLKTFNKLAKSAVDIEINMIEASQVLRKEQWKLLCKDNQFGTTQEGFNVSKTVWGNSIKWLDTEKDIVSDPSVANYTLAHEFFDALPIKSFQRTEQGWRELVVEHTPSVVNTQMKLPGASIQDDELLDTQFHLTVSPKESPSSMIPKLSSRYKDLPVGSRIEICTEAELYILKMAQLLNNEDNLGGVLVIDYGVTGQIPAQSLRGIYKHKFVSPFIKPGEVDLSIDVDFDNLVAISSKCSAPFGPVHQGDWLHTLGIGHRIDQLLKKNSENYHKQDQIYSSYRRLTDPEAMGSIYKVLCLMPKKAETPVGFGGSI